VCVCVCVCMRVRVYVCVCGSVWLKMARKSQFFSRFRMHI